MTTATLQLKLQRNRFAQHAVAALFRSLPRALRPGFVESRTAPASSRAEQAASEAREVRAMAGAWSRTDPGFAADLYAAAARHETRFAD